MTDMLNALMNHDLPALSQQGMIGWIYVIFFTVIFLESALLPAAFLPGDSLLLLAGALIAKGILPFYPTLGLLVAATGIGYWLNYLLGRWLSHTKPIQKWLSGVPAHTHQQANALSERYGPLALLFGRFLGFVRTLLPLLVGISGLRSGKFQLFNWLGALLWVYALMTAGGALTDIPLFRDNEAQGMSLLLILPVMLLVVGIATSIIIAQQRRRQNKGKKKLDE